VPEARGQGREGCDGAERRGFRWVDAGQWESRESYVLREDRNYQNARDKAKRIDGQGWLAKGPFRYLRRSIVSFHSTSRRLGGGPTESGHFTVGVAPQDITKIIPTQSLP
jgi:hypothetical protein